METGETVIAKWEIDKSQIVFLASVVTFVLFFLAAASFTIIFLLEQSTNIVLLIIPILLLLVFFGSLPEFFKSLGAVGSSSEVYLTNQGIYKKNPASEKDYKFIPWTQMSGYDVRYLGSKSLLGKAYPRPNQFFIKSKYEEDNFAVEAFSENTDVLRAYFQENNVPFGFAKA